MTRRQIFGGEIESSDSEREDNDGATTKRGASYVRSASKTLGRRIRKSPRSPGSPDRAWRTTSLKWKVFQAKNYAESRSDTEDSAEDVPPAYSNTCQSDRHKLKKEPSLSDPESWVWREKKNAKLAVAIDDTKKITLDVSLNRNVLSNRSVPENEGTCPARVKPKEKLWLNGDEMPLVLREKPDPALVGALKQTSIDNFFRDKSAMAKCKAELGKIPKKGTRVVNDVPPADTSPGLHESVSPSVAEVGETSSNKDHHGVPKSIILTLQSSTLNTPAPATHDNGRMRRPRAVKENAPSPLDTTTPEPEATSPSEFIGSGNPSDAVDETESTGDCEATEESDSDENDEGSSSAAKRIKTVRRLERASASPVLQASPDEDDSGLDTAGGRAKERNSAKHIDSFNYKIGIDETLKPLCKIEDIFCDITTNARKLGLDEAIIHLQGRKLKIATMCSGTESPLLAIQLVSNELKKHGKKFEFEHQFSAEIVPFKQAYIERNFAPSIIYRDIKELSIPGAIHATTAYGGLAQIPGDLDLLVAGFSCVDFSNLNNEKKTIKSGGESGDTFDAIMDYAEKYRPKIIILENVDGAPWPAIRDKAMPEIGYAAEFYKVDTKKYYIPQTRCRGYMICVDAREYHDPDGKHHVLKASKVTKSILSKWVATLMALQRPASCPVEAFLLAEDDPRTIRGRTELATSGRGERRMKPVDWDRCRGRHQEYRADLSLGQKRPLTKWEDGGSRKPGDYMWQDWIRNQVDRVCDTIDISWLRNLNRGFDHQYKCRLLELSQNVDRVKDNSGSGIAGCITPTGIPFSTMRGGPLIGLEALSLQGLPVDKLQLTREKQSQLQDLAGNAMSSTVVGPAILAALIAGYCILPPASSSSMDTDCPVSLSKLYGEQELVQFNLDLTSYQPTSAAALLDAAARTIRLCLCEGRELVTTKPLQQCSLCKHTTCFKCGGNPSHKYVPIKQEILSQRLAPASFGDFIKKALPMKLTFSKVTLEELQEENKNNIDTDLWNTTVGAIRNAFTSVLRFNSIKRSEIWTVYYDSEYASLQLVLSNGATEWRLYAKPPPDEPVNSDVRKLLSRHIARMLPTGADIMKGLWQFWLPKEHAFCATIQAGGGLTRSFENIQGFGKFSDTEVWEQYSISIPEEVSLRLDVDVSGTYKLLPDCGTAMGSLHVECKSAVTGAPLFLFLDPHRTHHPEEDYFVFSFDKRRIDYGEVRPVVVRIDASWRPQKVEEVGGDGPDEVAKYRINGSEKLVTLSEAQLPTSVQCAVDGQWIDLPAFGFDSSKDQAAVFHHAPPTFTTSPSVNSCQIAHMVLNCVATINMSVKSPWQTNDWIEVLPVQYKEFFTAFGWLTQKASNLPGLEKWKEFSDQSVISCQMCAPDAPGISWRLEAPKTAKRKVENNQPDYVKKNQPSKLVAFEDLEQAATFERLLKSRPPPMVTQIHIDNDGLLQLRIAVNPETLMHRASAKLLSIYDGTGMSMSWRLCTNQSSPPEVSLPEFMLKNNNLDKPAASPPGFLHKLRPEQQRSLAWMIRQESDESQPFIEEEVEEASISQIGWRAEGRARKSVFVHGGVLADQVGYGKTVTTLALIDTQRARDRERAKNPVKGHIPIRATLILVPHQLPDQWHREIKKFLHKNRAYNVLVVRTVMALQKLTVAEFQNADIIIVSWSLCEGDNYLFSVAQFAGMVELAEKSANRPAAAWYKEAVKEISTHVTELQEGGRGLQQTIAQKLEVSKTKAAAEETFIPSKRLRGQAYQKAKQGAATGSKRKHPTTSIEGSKNEALKPRSDIFRLGKIASGKISWKAMACPLLELFEFSRIVIDEYTYITGQESLTIPYLKTKSRWILSATPPLRDFADVKCIAKFLGVNLGIDDITPGVIKAGNIKALEKDRTDSELFQSFNLSHSASWHQHRHSVAQRFLHQFVRQNVADIEEIKGATHIMPIILPAAERAIYIELNQLLAGNDFDLKKCKLKDGNDRDRRIREILGNSESAGEALMKCASHFTLGDLDRNFQNAQEACEVILKLRQSQCDTLIVEFKQKLKEAEWLRNECSADIRQYSSWKDQVGSNDFGDGDSTEEIQSLIKAAELGYAKGHWTEFYVTAKELARIGSAAKDTKAKMSQGRTKRGQGKKATKSSDSEDLDMTDDDLNDAKPDNRRLKPEGKDPHRNIERAALSLRNVTNDLRKLSVELVIRRRCLRFFQCARDLQKVKDNTWENEVSGARCSCEKCGNAEVPLNKVSILSQCGHTVCDDCLEMDKDRDDQCLVKGCSAVKKTYQVIKAAELCVGDDTTRVGKHYGKKLEDIMRLLKMIPEDEQVLLFVQFADLMQTIISTLEENQITYSTLSNMGRKDEASKILTEFQTNKSASRKKVLILAIGDASAAGSNLTNANHVIFVSPYFTESLQTYNHAMTQAMGRARRYGQTKPVHIYHFLSLKTVDVDRAQLHSGKILVENVTQPPEFSPYVGFIPSGLGLIRGADGDKGRFGSAETSEVLLESEDA